MQKEKSELPIIFEKNKLFPNPEKLQKNFFSFIAKSIKSLGYDKNKPTDFLIEMIVTKVKRNSKGRKK